MSQEILYHGCRYVLAAPAALPHQALPAAGRKRKLVPAIRVDDGAKVMVAPETLKTQPQQYKARQPDDAEAPEVGARQVRTPQDAPRPAVPPSEPTQTDSPYAPLLAAMAAKRIPQRLSAKEIAAELLPEQLPSEAQTAVRTHLRSLLDYLHLHHHGVKRGGNVYQLQQSDESYGQYDPNEGVISVNADVHQRAMKFLADPTNPKHQKYADDASTLIHETIHSTSPMHAKVYNGHGAFIEEATTEILARRVMREKFGIPEKKWRNRDGTPSGSYADEIHSLSHIVSTQLGQHALVSHEKVYRMIEDAAAKMRQKQPRNLDRRNPYVQHFADSLEFPPEVFAGLDAAGADERRRQLANQIADEITKQHEHWQGY